MSDPGLHEIPGDPALAPRGDAPAPAPVRERAWPTPTSGDAVIAVSRTGAVTAINATAVALLGVPVPHQFGLGLSQFIPARYHRVIDAWSDRQGGDARAAHHDPLTLSLTAVRADGCEVWVLLTRRMLGDAPSAPYLVTMRTVANGFRPDIPPVPPFVRYQQVNPSPLFG